MNADIIAFLNARYDEAEQVARNADPAPWQREYGAAMVHGLRDANGGRIAKIGVDTRNVHHMLLHDPARVLADLDAKRRIIAEYERYAAERRRAMNGWESSREVSPILVALALPYAEHPDYRPEWKPA